MKKQTGFTLIELIVTLAIVGVLLTLGLPSMKTFVQGDRLIASSNDLLSALHIARSEAIKQNVSVTLCESEDGQTCNIPGTGKWQNGWIVFIDTNRDLVGTGAACAAPNTDCLLRVHDTFNDNKLSIEGIFDGDSTAINALIFTSRGLPQDSLGIAQSGEFSICTYDASDNVLKARAVTYGLPGRARVRSPDVITSIACPATP